MALIYTMLSLVSFQAVAQQDPNHTFNYQGELIENGVPANGNYDITITPFFTLDQNNTQHGGVSEHLNVAVSEGLFTINNVDILDPMSANNPFDGQELYLEIAVRNAGGGAYTPLVPRQQLHSVPFAYNLTRNGASSGQVLTFRNGWVPETNISSPWIISNNSEINYSGNVGIGISNPETRLHVRSNTIQPAVFDGGDRMSVGFRENGLPRGYVGSHYAGADSHVEDFEIGTDNTIGNMLITTNTVPRITVTPNGNVGIGTITPTAKLTVDGITHHNGDIKQFNDRNGGLKYMVKATCGMTGSSIIRRYIGALGIGSSGSGIAVTIMNGPTDGRCTISFPSFIHERYWVVSPDTDANRSSNCIITTNTALNCRSYTPNTGVGITSNITVLVY